MYWSCQSLQLAAKTHSIHRRLFLFFFALGLHTLTHQRPHAGPPTAQKIDIISGELKRQALSSIWGLLKNIIKRIQQGCSLAQWERKCIVTLVNTVSQLFSIVTTPVSAGLWVIAEGWVEMTQTNALNCEALWTFSVISLLGLCSFAFWTMSLGCVHLNSACVCYRRNHLYYTEQYACHTSA